MLSIHDVRTNRNYNAFYKVCKEENIDFFMMIDLVKLLKETLDYGESINKKRISYNRVKDMATLKRLRGEGHELLDAGYEAFTIKYKTLLAIEKIYEIQKEEDRCAVKYMIEYGSVQFMN